MRNLGGTAIELAKAALVGYLVVFVVGLSALIVTSAVALAAGVSSLSVGFGPIPLLSFWNSAAGYGFQSEWGLAALAICGAVAGVGLELRHSLMRPA
jgi:hypothetical protein